MEKKKLKGRGFEGGKDRRFVRQSFATPMAFKKI